MRVGRALTLIPFTELGNTEFTSTATPQASRWWSRLRRRG